MKIKTDNKIRILLFMLITTMLVFIKPIIGYSNTQLYVKQGGSIRVSNTLEGEINSNNKEKKLGIIKQYIIMTQADLGLI